MTASRARTVPTVLVVDDDPDVRIALTDALTDEQYAVVCAADGREAIDYLQAHAAPAVIVLDWMMPNCNGPCFREMQAQDARLAAIPVILLTADTRVERELDEIGVDAYLPKPVMLDVLLSLVRRYAEP